MKTLEPNSFSELLLQFMEDDLPEPQQEALFAELSRNSSLRDELSQHILIAKTVQESLLVPPSHVRASALAAIGASTTSLPIAAPTATGSQTILKSTLFTLGGFIAGVAVMMFFGVIPAATTNTQSSIQTAITTSPIIATPYHQTTPSGAYQEGSSSQRETLLAATSRQGSQSGLSRNQHQASHTRHTYAIQENNAITSAPPYTAAQIHDADDRNSSPRIDSKTSALQETAASNNASVLQSPAHSIQQLSTQQQEDSHPLPSLPSPSAAQETDNASPLWGAHIEVRGFSMMSFPSFGLPGLIRPPINNVAISLRKDITTQLSVGAEIGQETLLQLYATTNTQSTTTMQQNYLALWAGVNAQWKVWETSTNHLFSLTPLLRTTVGATELGPMLRVGIGTLVSVGSQADVLLIGEASSFAYTENSHWYSTQKAGVSFGIQVHF